MKKRIRIALIGGTIALTGLGATTFAVAAITKHEHRHGGHHQMYPFAADSDQDGMISKEEFLAKNTQRFTAVDTDGDGVISPTEFSARPMAMFTRLDANKDGMLAADELPKRHHKKRRHHHKHHDGHSHDHEFQQSSLNAGALVIEEPVSSLSGYGIDDKMHSLIILPPPATAVQNDG